MLRRLLLVLVIVVIPTSMLWANEIIRFVAKDGIDQFSRDQGEDLTGVELFEEANVPPEAVAVFDDAFGENVTEDDAAGLAFLNELDGKNLRIRHDMIVSNVREERPEDNRGLFAADINTIVGASNFLEDSIDLNFAEPNRASVALDVDPLSADSPALIDVHISIFNEQDEGLLGGKIDALYPKKSFFDVVSMDTTGRIDTDDWARSFDGCEYTGSIRICPLHRVWVPEHATFAWLVLGGVSLMKSRGCR